MNNNNELSCFNTWRNLLSQVCQLLRSLSSPAHAVVSSPDSDQNIYPPSPDSETMHSVSYGTSYTHLRVCILWIPPLRFTSAVLHPCHTCKIILFGPNAVNFSHSFPIFIMLRKSEMRADWEG